MEGEEKADYGWHKGEGAEGVKVLNVLEKGLFFGHFADWISEKNNDDGDSQGAEG